LRIVVALTAYQRLGHFVTKENVDNYFFKRYFLCCMDTLFLDSFVAVIDHGSIAEAARRLNLTPAAVAQRIRTLEHEIGSPLVVRSGRTVRATASGAAILGRARGFLRDVRDLQAIAAGDRPAGELRLGAMPTAITGLLPDILTLMAERYPKIEVHITRDTSAVLYRRVQAEELDAAIIVRPPFPLSKAYGWQELREEPLVVLTPASMRVRDPHLVLARHPYIRLDPKTWAGHLVDGYLRKARIRTQERFELGDLEAIAVMVDRGLGVSLVPDWAPPWPENLSLRKLPVRGRSFSRRIGLAWSKATVRLRLVEAFLEQAKAAAAGKRADRPRPSRPHRAGGRLTER
jgi:DNA-binding transcriptional LysR family regulator